MDTRKSELRRTGTRAVICLAISVWLVVPADAQSTPEGPSTRNGAWTLASFPPTTFPPSTVPEAEAFSNEARQLLSQGRVADARAAWEKAIALDPAHPSAYWRIGALSTDSVAGAALIHRQVEMAPSPPAYLHGAFILQNQNGRTDEALAMWHAGTRRYPGDRNMAALYGEALFSASLFDDAVLVLEEETRRKPGSSRLRLHLGRAYIAVGDPEAGLTELREAARLEDTPQMWHAQAHILATAELDLNAAVGFAQRLVAEAEAENATLEPGVGGSRILNATIRLFRAWDVLSLAYTRRGDAEAARTYGEAAWRLSPNATSLARLGEVAERTGDIQTAVADYARAAMYVGPGVEALRAHLETLVPAESVGDHLLQAQRWDQQFHIRTFTAEPGGARRAEMHIRTDRTGRISTIAPARGNDSSLDPLITRIRDLPLPFTVPEGSRLDRLVLPWVLSCEPTGACRLRPFPVPRTSPFAPF